MLNYIKSECWRTLRSRGYFAFFGACLVLLIILNCAPTEPFNTLEFSLQFVISAIYIVPFLTICVSDLVFGNEHKGQTLKNVLAYGFTKRQIYLGKYMVQLIFAFAIAIVVFGGHLLTGFLLMETAPASLEALQQYLVLLGSSVPMWMACLALGNACLFLVKNGTVAGFVAIGVLVVPSAVVGIGGIFNPVIAKLDPYVLLNQQAYLRNSMPIDLPTFSLSAVVSLAYLAIFLLGGMALFEKKEL